MIAFLVATSLLLISSGAGQTVSSDSATQSTASSGPMPDDRTRATGDFRLIGLVSPAFVSGTIFVSAQHLPTAASVTYYLDEQPCATSRLHPFRMGEDAGYSVDTLHPGRHLLRAEASLSNGQTLHSNEVVLHVVPSIDSRFSPGLTAYANQPTAQSKHLEEMLRDTSTPGATLSLAELDTRRQALKMYSNWGIDPSLDNANDQSEILRSLSPNGWSTENWHGGIDPLSLQFSSDAPFYQAIPHDWPRVLLPQGYIGHVQLNTTVAGDGIGIGVSVAHPEDHDHDVRSQWYDNPATLKTFPFRMASEWPRSIPWQPSGDHHMIFVDPASGAFVSTYMTQLNPETGGPNALYASSPTPFHTLGDQGGSIAAGFAELPALLQPGEATDRRHPIRHALGGAIARTWAARVYPASAWDANLRTSTNTCTGTGFTNTGIVPYGGIIQLDPKLDLASLGLTLPARRILEAIQTYGYYVEDFGCADLDIYTSVSEEEFDPYGGLWGYNRHGIGVQNEIESVLVNSKLYLVPPPVKKQ